MSSSLAIALSLLLCALPVTACAPSVIPMKRDPPADELMRKPARPLLAPKDADDQALAEERVRIAAWALKLEALYDGLRCYVLEQKPPCL